MGTQLPSLCWGLLFWTQPFYKATNWDGKRMILVVFAESTVPSQQAKLCSTIQVRPVILNARCRLLTIRSCHPWCCFRVRASLRLSWPASAIIVRILGNNALNPPSSRAPARRSDVSAGSTRLATSRPSVSTKNVAFASLYALVRVETTIATTFGRLDRLAIHDHHRWTSCPSGMTAGLLVEHSM